MSLRTDIEVSLPVIHGNLEVKNFATNFYFIPSMSGKKKTKFFPHNLFFLCLIILILN